MTDRKRTRCAHIDPNGRLCGVPEGIHASRDKCGTHDFTPPSCAANDDDTALRCMKPMGHDGPHWVELEWEDATMTDPCATAAAMSE